MIEVRLHCRPNGVIIEGAWKRFDTAPVVGDIIELPDMLSLCVIERRFTPTGRLWVKCEPHIESSSYTIDKLKAAFDKIRD